MGLVLVISCAAEYPAPRYVSQRQDHFDDRNDNHWQQAYYVNDTFWTPGSSAPIFLCVGGEGPALDGSAVVSSNHCNLAVEWLSETRALLFALEHRYYGCHNMSACPVESFSEPLQGLRFLSSRQAIEDVASFVRHMNRVYNLGPSNKWVTWGGSYPGMLAGWSRLKHPQLIHAAVASSAPVLAKPDMHEYNDAVARAYAVADNDVGGSAACAGAIREGHRAVELMLDRGQTAALEQFLQIPSGGLATRAGQLRYLGPSSHLAVRHPRQGGVARFPAEANDPTCGEPACNIGRICAVMLNATLGDELQRLVVLRHLQGPPSAPSRTAARVSGRAVSKAGRARRPRRASAARAPTARAARAARADRRDELPDFWHYQTCTEFGFYQSCASGSACPFVRGLVDLQSEARGCGLYNISLAAVERAVEATNSHYGGLRPSGPGGRRGSCVLWVNGEVDPWASLSVLASRPGQPVLWVPGASHHAWTHPAALSDQPSVVEARGLIRGQVRTFLAQGCQELGSPDELRPVILA